MKAPRWRLSLGTEHGITSRRWEGTGEFRMTNFEMMKSLYRQKMDELRTEIPPDWKRMAVERQKNLAIMTWMIPFMMFALGPLDWVTLSLIGIISLIALRQTARIWVDHEGIGEKFKDKS
jgi:hypothetical protein